MRNMRKGYFTPPVLIILAIIIFAVAILIAINTDLVKRLKNEALPTPVSSPTTQQPSPTTDETANWETYKNTERGYSIKYPNDFKVDKLNSTVVLYKGEKLDVEGSADPYLTALAIYDGSLFGSSAKEACEAELCRNISNPAVGHMYEIEDVKVNNT